MEEIETEFLALRKENKSGYFIPFENLCKWLKRMDLYNKYASNTDIRKCFNRRYLRNNKYALIEAKKPEDEGDFIMIKNESNISFPWFTADGFKMACMILKSEQSFLVMRYFIQLEKKYWYALHTTQEENKKEIDKINTYTSHIINNDIPEPGENKNYKKQYCYIISNNVLSGKNLYKFGYSAAKLDGLLSAYSRGLPNACIFGVYYSNKANSLEKKILKYFKKYRQTNHNNNLSEWINLDIEVIKNYVSYLMSNEFDYFEKKLFE